MATSSITKNFVITDETAVESFLNAYETAEKQRDARGSFKPSRVGQELKRGTEEWDDFMAKWGKTDGK